MASTLRVNPTRMELTRIKRRLVTAKRGHKLLKDKRDEMVRQFILLVRENAKLRKEVENELQGALAKFALARAVMDSQALEEAVMYPARSAAVEIGLRNVLSVHVPTITPGGDRKGLRSAGGRDRKDPPPRQRAGIRHDPAVRGNHPLHHHEAG